MFERGQPKISFGVNRNGQLLNLMRSPPSETKDFVVVEGSNVVEFARKVSIPE